MPNRADQRIDVTGLTEDAADRVINARARATLRHLREATPEDSGALRKSLHIQSDLSGRRARAYVWDSPYASHALRRPRVWRRVLKALNRP